MNDTPPSQSDQFAAWLREHGRILHHVAHGFAAGSDREDLMQELLLALWQAIPRFAGESTPATFIYRVAHNTALTWKRTQKNYQRRLDTFEVTLDKSSRVDPPGAGLREAETLELVYALIREFPPVDRSLLLLHLDGIAYTEIAALHGLSVSNVGVRLNRLKQKLTSSLHSVSHELR
ncbi:MAG TPA: sigma-70 family RNA polymerase sigma factor [Opitutaceae bacterium]|nr:sigma-70 family RNA polymerase sigma factor [Opitutaceae bacterium]